MLYRNVRRLVNALAVIAVSAAALYAAVRSA